MASNIIAVATAATAWALGLVGSLERLQYPFMRQSDTPVTRELASQLSPQARIHYPGSSGFDLATDRWNTWKNPHLDIVVEVTTENDVVNTINFANANDKPFIAISGQHGANVALADVRNGVGVWMRSMTDVDIADDGLSASFGGGIKAKKLLHSLWNDGKMTVVGCCECTGATAVMLGGGHGWLQGRYGLMADNLMSARAVLANGSAITVSNDEHPDLFWGLRGAGHNFAILTSFESRIYDRTPENENWVVDTMIFTADKFDGVHNQANRLIEGNHPVELIHVILWSMVPDIDPDRPIILSIFVYQGKEIPEELVNPFLVLEPVVHNSIVTDLPGVAPAIQFSDSDPACQHGSTLLRFPVNLERYNLDGLRSAFAIFSNVSTPFKGSMMILEAYSTHGVQAVAEETTAYPDRQNKLLLSPFIWYNADESLDDKAAEYGRQIRDALVDASGKPLHAYVNYAFGDESHQALYGYEPWRLEKLQRLKETYDPHGRFGYYNPI